MFEFANHHSLVLRTTRLSADGRNGFGFDRPIRQAMLSGLASSCGFGPRIFATWIVPEGAHHAMMEMNRLDAYSSLGDGVTRRDPDPLSGADVWWDSPTLLDDSNRRGELFAAKPIDEGPTPVRGIRRQYSDAKMQRLQCRTAYTLMEGFEGSVDSLVVYTQEQEQLMVDQVYEQCSLMGAAGFLHANIKPSDSVYHTHNKDGTPPHATSGMH